jgi:hypothetical protein
MDPAALPESRHPQGCRGEGVRSLGNDTVPTVVVAGRALVNPSKRQVIGTVRQYAPHTLDGGR